MLTLKQASTNKQVLTNKRVDEETHTCVNKRVWTNVQCTDVSMQSLTNINEVVQSLLRRNASRHLTQLIHFWSPKYDTVHTMTWLMNVRRVKNHEVHGGDEHNSSHPLQLCLFHTNLSLIPRQFRKCFARSATGLERGGSRVWANARDSWTLCKASAD